MELDQSIKKAIAASVGAMISSIFVTPLDVAKVRLQMQNHIQKRSQTSDSYLLTKMMRLCQCKCNHPVSKSIFASCCRQMSCKHCALPPPRLTGTFHALRYILRTEGIAGLYAGFSPTLLISVPSTILYYVSYDCMLQEGRKQLPESVVAVPLLAGASARVIAATTTSPIEFIRTRMQGTPSRLGVVEVLFECIRRDGYRSLLKGLGSTLARDVPFSAIYWSCYEAMQFHSDSSRFSANTSRTQRAFYCGAMSGVVAAACTTPFDVVKTLQQVDSIPKGLERNSSTISILKHIMVHHGYSGLFSGLTARLARIAPSCGIMIASYESIKSVLGIPT